MPTRKIYDYVPHKRTSEKLDHASHPVKVSELLPHDSPTARFNSWFAVKVTTGVGTMWCAYAFAALALVPFSAPFWTYTVCPARRRWSCAGSDLRLCGGVV